MKRIGGNGDEVEVSPEQAARSLLGATLRQVIESGVSVKAQISALLYLAAQVKIISDGGSARSQSDLKDALERAITETLEMQQASEQYEALMREFEKEMKTRC